MKVRIPKIVVEPLVLFYGLAEEKKERLTALLGKESVPCKEAVDADLCQKTGYLCGLPGFAPSESAETTSFPYEAVIFCGFNDRTLDKILRLFRENDLKIERKAALTPANQNWLLGDLLREIDREHEQMSGRR